MTMNRALYCYNRSQGQSMIELALVLPLLLMLVLGVVDFARAIQFNNILVAMSREGANLASRSSESPQNIMRALANTAAPLAMASHGRIYITEIIGRKVVPTCVDSPPTFCTTFPQVQAQTRSTNGASTLPSRVWNCPNSWLGNGSCHQVLAWGNTTAAISIPLKDGEIVYAVETIYDYTVLVNYVMDTGPKLYSLTVL